MSLPSESAIPEFLQLGGVPDFLELGSSTSPVPDNSDVPPPPKNPAYVSAPPVPAPPIEPTQIDIKQYSHPRLAEYVPAVQRFFRVLALTGVTSRAIDVSGVSRHAVYKLREKDPVFLEIWEDCLKYRGEAIEDEAFRRAVTGVNKAVYYMGRVVGHEKVYSDTLLSKMLEGAMPEKYRSNFKIDMDANVKGAIATLVIPAEMSEAEWTQKYNVTNEKPKQVEGETFYEDTGSDE